IAWQLVRLQARQISSSVLHSNGGRFMVFIFALLQSQLLLSLYQDWVLSVLISREPPAPVNNVDQLLAQLATGRSRLVISSS
ncbi:hypothetical protein AAVH_27970, partial [Aphelenchoides avenae]